MSVKKKDEPDLKTRFITLVEFSMCVDVVYMTTT